MYKLRRLGVGLLPHRLLLLQSAVLLLCFVMIAHSQATVVYRFLDRSLYINNSEPGATTSYKVSFTYNNEDPGPPQTIGSVELLFCMDPIPRDPVYHPCVPPPGLNVSNATLSDQTGIDDFTILSKTTNRIVLTRSPTQFLANVPSSYTFDNIVNPNYNAKSYAIRLMNYASTDASGSFINLGSVMTQVNDAIFLETQVPPMLIFCMAGGVELNCTGTTGGNYVDMGDLSPTETLRATSQMAIGTNASGGYVVTVNGGTMASGSSVIKALATPTASAPGNNQFGLNLVANSSPAMGFDPDGPFTNASAASGYSTPNLFKYVDGDVVASASNVSLMRRFTMSYIVNAPPDLRAGVYTTTLTYICTGRF